MFELSFGTTIQNYDTRSEAIQAAREVSAEHRGMVNLLGDEGRERMTYQGGELLSYDYETRRRG
jgi:hypothetical protein